MCILFYYEIFGLKVVQIGKSSSSGEHEYIHSNFRSRHTSSCQNILLLTKVLTCQWQKEWANNLKKSQYTSYETDLIF